jgi:hypothetical protein
MELHGNLSTLASSPDLHPQQALASLSWPPLQKPKRVQALLWQ